jgi:hypothetical protein
VPPFYGGGVPPIWGGGIAPVLAVPPPVSPVIPGVGFGVGAVGTNNVVVAPCC